MHLGLSCTVRYFAVCSKRFISHWVTTLKNEQQRRVFCSRYNKSWWKLLEEPLPRLDNMQARFSSLVLKQATKRHKFHPRVEKASVAFLHFFFPTKILCKL